MRIVLTGPPGAGKTSIIESLYKMGHNIISEPARDVLEKYNKYSPELLPSKSEENRKLFQIEIERISINNYHLNNDGFFDRSIIDEIGYSYRYDLAISDTLEKAAKELRYDKVFIFPFWEEIYQNDDIRKETSQEAQLLYNYLHKAYISYGYSPIIVPKTSIENRIKFIIENI